MNNNISLGIISALFILVGSWVLSWTNFCGGTTETPAKFFFTDGAFKTKGVDSYSFQKSGFFLTVPVATSGEFKKIAAHFKSNKNRTLSLVGKYYTSEKYTGKSSLGKERAEAIKAKLIKYGAPAGSIFTSGKQLNEEVKGKKLYNAVMFEGNEKVVEGITPIEVENSFSILNPFIISFGSDGTKPEMTEELTSYLEIALTYLDENPDKVLLVTGYTDNQGTSKSNIKLSEKRAYLVRRLLRDVGGVPSKKIKNQGKGEANEIASNDSEDGRALNNRVEITIQ